MTELLPSLQAERVRTGLVDYLSTTFALTDVEPREALSEFLVDPVDGIFKGPYVRLRLPFRTVDPGDESPLDWSPPFPPYRHQLEAYRRLTSKDLGPDKPRPLPSVVTTGTGSGKTEAFLNPILDHVLRARRDGVTGMKALILYPMNALADDQAGRLTKLLLDDPALANVTAGLYTGDARAGQGQGRSKVTKDGLITDRSVLRDDPPDILLTNYKMLDQLLLRPDDAPLWAKSALSLTYLVLDEFHTYDGAQGTDVAMLLRRLGLRLRSHVPDDHPERAVFEGRPLGKVTPVATSATLGDGNDPSAMLAFAAQVFGETFPREAAVTERRVDVEEHSEAARAAVAAHDLLPRRLRELLSTDIERLAAVGAHHRDEPDRLVDEVGRILYDLDDLPAEVTAAALIRAHPDVRAMVEQASEAVPLRNLASAAFSASSTPNATSAAIATILAALSHLRLADRAAVSVEVTLWVRELTRLGRVVSDAAGFRWNDDGAVLDDAAPALPALYCRSCGRSGWGVSLAPTGRDLASTDTNIRVEHLRRSGRFRTLLHAPGEDALVAQKRTDGDPNPELHAPNLRWLDIEHRTILTKPPVTEGAHVPDRPVLPVVMLDGDTEEIERQSKDDVCPSCGRRDQIRFLGSAIATQLSVTLSTLFGDRHLDTSEKRALVFTDSVQDAAHRAGFVDTRSHTLSLRAALRDSLTEPTNLEDWVEEVLRRAADDPFHRYRLVPRALVDHEAFEPYWNTPDHKRIPTRSIRSMRRRLLFDIEQEVGLRSSYGRTLEATGSIGVQVSPGIDDRLVGLARQALDSSEQTAAGPAPSEADLLRWARGLLEHLRRGGAIEHEWLFTYVKEDGNRYMLSGRRRRDQGQPGLGRASGAPEFAVTEGTVDPRSDFVRVTSPQSWYARWAQKCLGVNGAHGASVSARLLKLLASAAITTETVTAKGARAYGIPAANIVAVPLSDDDLRTSVTCLVCDTCHGLVPTTPALGALFEAGPCPTSLCPGRLGDSPQSPDAFYRRLYATADMRRVDAHEHTGLIEAVERRRIEAGFKRPEQQPSDPNVLVATPTLEMGIDIGDLTTVMLSSLPDSVAKYLQRVGRAGRLTGSSLALAYVTGRGDQLPRLGDPTSMINGAVRPPATYLDAEEILRRQFLAFVIDDLVQEGYPGIPRRAGNALESAERGTFLGDVVERVRARGPRLLERFVDTFADGDTVGLRSLRVWADLSSETTDNLAATIYRAVAGHKHDVEELRRRRKEIVDAIPELRERADLPAATDDDKAAYRTAVGTNKLLRKTLSDMTDAAWISGLEVRGLLPNYSLLDDKVELDVQISWVDPDTQKFDNDSLVLDRGSARALTELAPGTWFYARGLQMKVDGIEVGRDQAEVELHVLCDQCGHLATLASPNAASPTSCPRCGSSGIADTGQRFDAVRLRRVFSDIRRDDSKIGDGDDSRRSTRFEILAAADFDPSRLVAQWSVEEIGLEVSHYRRLPIRWFNLGQSTNSPSSRLLAGRDLAAPLFRVCDACGKLDRDAGTNSPREHRAWCPHRTSVTEHTRNVALFRELVTQGVAVSLPPSVTGDEHSVPSLQAALLLGLRETMGGAPDHLRIEVVPHPLGTMDGQTREALLLHDVVPGGTGYLTDLASPERLRSILLRAARVLEDCPCAAENRASCHRCLLPFVRNGSAATRRDALRALRVVLDADDDTSFASIDPEASTWRVVQGAVDPGWGESSFEQQFRTKLAERLTPRAAVKQVTGSTGPELRISAGGGRDWVLRPQVLMHGTKPDFVLDPKGGADRFAIYTDGHAFHAAPPPGKNRIAEDAEKRRVLRANGIRVLALAWGDLDGTGAPDWLNQGVIAALMKNKQGAGISQAVVKEIADGPLGIIEGIVHDPNSPARTTLSEVLPTLLAASPPNGGRTHVAPGTSLSSFAAELLDGAEHQPVPGGEQIVLHRTPHLVFAARMHGLRAKEVALVLDDRESAVADKAHADSWRQWLRLSNVIGLSDVEATITARTLVRTDPADTTAPATPTVMWSGADLDGLDQDVLSVAASLSAEGVEQPEIFAEVGDGVMADMAWDRRKVAVLGSEAEQTDVDDLRSAGWTVIRVADGDIEQAVRLARAALMSTKD